MAGWSSAACVEREAQSTLLPFFLRFFFQGPTIDYWIEGSRQGAVASLVHELTCPWLSIHILLSFFRTFIWSFNLQKYIISFLSLFIRVPARSFAESLVRPGYVSDVRE